MTARGKITQVLRARLSAATLVQNLWTILSRQTVRLYSQETNVFHFATFPFGYNPEYRNTDELPSINKRTSQTSSLLSSAVRYRTICCNQSDDRWRNTDPFKWNRYTYAKKDTLFLFTLSSSLLTFSNFRSHPPSLFDTEWLARDAGCTSTVNTPAYIPYTIHPIPTTYYTPSPHYPLQSQARWWGVRRKAFDQLHNRSRWPRPMEISEIERSTLEHLRDPFLPRRIDFNSLVPVRNFCLSSL